MDLKNQLSLEDRKEQVIAMNKRLLHRGPDDLGMYSDQFATLAMRRLAIIDQKRGQQPLCNTTKNIGIVFNGEIYNFRELKEELKNKGHQFNSQSDTEVLVHLYEEYGTDMLSMLKGMFCFCIYDLKEKKYFLARDRFGEKPLYYHWGNQTFSFASEMPALLENKYLERKLNQKALPYYFRTSLVPEPMTLFENIYSLQPGHYLLVSENGLREEIYFTPKYHKNPSIIAEAEAIEYIQPYLQKAVERQTVSDVPIGAFLSGGIDSSTVVAILQKHSSKKIQTFNVRFEHQAFDESSIARKVAKHCGTDHHELMVPDFDFNESIFWKIIDHVGLPFRDSSAIPSFLISQEIAKHVKVALSGDGGDELFGGYQLFEWYRKIVDLKKINRPIRSMANAGLGMAQTFPGFSQSSKLRKVKRGLNTSLASFEDIPIALNEMFPTNSMAELMEYPGDWKDFTLLKDYIGLSKDWSDLRKIMYYRLKYTLPANMLIKIDRMSMANSLEVRAPFLDPDLFDASLQLADDLLMNNGQGKYILRKIMAAELPKEVFEHPKTGFNIPLFKYQNENFKQLARRLLFDENPWPDLIDEKDLEAIYVRGISTKKDNARQSVFQATHQLWMMMMLFGWAKRFKVQN